MTAVWTTTEEFPELSGFLAERRARGLDTYDEWWEGVYRTVTGPTPEHDRLIMKLGSMLDPLVEARDLHQAGPVNIGIDKKDCRVPDLGIYHPDTPRTSPAFLASALLVVEVLSPSEQPQEKMPFFYRWGVEEYLEIDPLRGVSSLWVRSGLDWKRATVSPLLGITVEPDLVVVERTVLKISEFTGSGA